MNPLELQTLALINNYICSGQTDKSVSTLKAYDDYCCGRTKYTPPSDILENFYANQPSNNFGKNWNYENLDDKSLEIFCDHGIGDTVMMFRYIKKLKDIYDVKIILNCIASDLTRFLSNLEFVDVFTTRHSGCDYHTNIMQLPKMFDGETEWKDILRSNIPEQPLLVPCVELEFDEVPKIIGTKLNSSTGNQKLFVKKSVPTKLFIKRLSHWQKQWMSLEKNGLWTHEKQTQVSDHSTVHSTDIAGMMGAMAKCSSIISVDTLQLHLGGSMSIPTIGLLAKDADPRWGNGEKTPWYPSVTLLRQEEEGNWENVLNSLDELLTKQFGLM